MLFDMKSNGKIMLISSLIIMTILTTPISPISITTTNKSQQVFAGSNSGLTSKTTPHSNNQFDDMGGSNAFAGKDDVQGKIIGIKKAKSFSPNPLSVKFGDTITWTNEHREGHTVTSGSNKHTSVQGVEFDSGNIEPGQSFSHTFNRAGNFEYYCIYHPSMVGMIIVSQ
jgi:aldose sugar dehydrogenase